MAELKAQLYLLEKEKKALELKLSTREAQEQAYLVHIEHLKSEVEEHKEQRMRSLSSTSSGGKDKCSKVGPRGQGDARGSASLPALFPPPHIALHLSTFVAMGTASHSRLSKRR